MAGGEGAVGEGLGAVACESARVWSCPSCSLLGWRLSEIAGIERSLAWPPALVTVSVVVSACINHKSQGLIPKYGPRPEKDDECQVTESRNQETKLSPI